MFTKKKHEMKSVVKEVNDNINSIISGACWDPIYESTNVKIRVQIRSAVRNISIGNVRRNIYFSVSSYRNEI